MFIEEVVFDEYNKRILLAHAEQAVFIDETMTPKEKFYWVKVEGDIVGYAVADILSGIEIIDQDDSEDEDIVTHLGFDVMYVYIDYLEIFESYQGRGYGKLAFNLLRAALGNKKVVIHTIGDTQDFWIRQGFTSIGFSDWYYWI